MVVRCIGMCTWKVRSQLGLAWGVWALGLNLRLGAIRGSVSSALGIRRHTEQIQYNAQ